MPAAVKCLLEKELQEIEKGPEKKDKSDGIKIKPVAVKPSVPRIDYTTLSTLSWDQDSDKVKIYIFIEGASQDRVIADFTPTSFDVRLQDVAGKHFRAAVHQLHGKIDPKRSSVAVKPKRITITMPKAERKHWLDLYHKESKFDKKDTAASKDNPMAGIMDLMKTLYDEGDDEMKKTIAKTWTESQAGKKPGIDPLKDMDYDFPTSSDKFDL
ncbi:calcyclin binding protein [Klebsormidium nitens]|uniref:Calcyclin binding protein n=1 Tax=Klebsormidium nitens TaxID=105231 RepID=A0A1Y1I8B3_KLENI|nr:calcyclin binding protein [Klebsormidium nitens]|eukprot:GAQ87180.1 calcyclin binding protein [Klebsormidium nitens]